MTDPVQIPILSYGRPPTGQLSRRTYAMMLLCAGAVSGFASAVAFVLVHIERPIRELSSMWKIINPLMWLPGLFYAMAVMVPAVRTGRASQRALIGAIPTCVGAFVITGVPMAMEFFAGMLYRDEAQYAFFMMIAGGIGAAIMGVYFVFALKLDRPFHRLMWYTLAGLAGGAVFGLYPLLTRPYKEWEWAGAAALLFVIWQSTTAFCLADGDTGQS